MSEIKRVALNTLEPQKVNDKVIKKLCKTVRISVILPESNEDNCPEYNYKDQLAAVVKRKVKQNKGANGVENEVDPFGENDDDVRRIALEMEAKYGSGVTKKKRKEKKDDYADIGMGYDESDSFIDNTDGYDEIIPQNVTTLHGGFYVNSGALVFKTDDEATSNASSSASSSSGSSSSSDSEGEDKDKQKPKNRKRILESSADSDSDPANPAQKEKKPKVQSATHSMQHAIKKKLFSTTKIQVKKRRLIDPLKKTVKDLLREKRVDLNMSVPDELKTVEDNIEKESSKENKKPMSITSVTDAIESVLKQVIEEGPYDNNQIKPPADVTPTTVLSQNKSDSSHSQPKEKENKQNLTRLEKEEVIKLPENLPADIEGIVSKLKEAALNYKGEGKKAFFTKDVNALLLNLEKKSKSISKSSRVKVYEHLSQYVNCTKDTLTRRARLLDLEDNERRLKSLQVKLKDAIDAIMPAVQEDFQLESQKILQKKFSKESENNEELKALKMPRRKFPWSEETKKLLKDVTSVKNRCLILEGKYKDSLLEEQVVAYLRTQIVTLWPEGWMYLNPLKKILNRMQDVAKSANSSANISSNSSVAVAPQKHSNLSITPVTNGKSSADKTEVTNSITVTKVVNNSDIVCESLKTTSKNSDKNVIAAGVCLVNENEPKNVSNTHNEITKSDIYKDFTTKQLESQENLPKVEPMEKASDLSTHSTKNDVFKPYVEDPSFSQVKKLLSDLSKTQNYQKQLKQNDMFKPYADEVISVERNIPDKPTSSIYEENLLSRAQIIPQYPEKDRHAEHSYSEREKLGSHAYSEKEKQGSTVYFEKDKYGPHTYSGKDEHIVRTYSEKDKHNLHTYSEKDKHSSHAYSEKDKHSSRTSEKDKPSSHSYPEKDKQISHTYSEKDRHMSSTYSEKDRHISPTYSEKDKRISPTYSEKDKRIAPAYSERDKLISPTYSEKDKHSSHTYSEKDKHSPHTYSERDKHSPHTYSERDKHSSHTYVEKDRHISPAYSDKDKHSSHTYPEKDKHAFRTYSEKDKRTYSEKDKHSHIYSNKDKHTSHTYSDKDKHSSRTYSDRDKHGVRTYSERDKHSSQSYSEKDKHSSQSYAEKDKHRSSQSDKKVEGKPLHLTEKPPQLDKMPHTEKSSNLTKPLEKPTDLSKFQMFKPYSDTPTHHLEDTLTYNSKDLSSQLQRPIDYKAKEEMHHRIVEAAKSISQDAPNLPTKSYATPSDFVTSKDLSSKHQRPIDYKAKEEMHHRIVEAAKSISQESPNLPTKSYATPSDFVTSKDLSSKHQRPIDYKAKEEMHHRLVDVPKSVSQDSSNVSTKSYATPSDFITSRYDVPSSKHRIANTHSFQGGNVGNDISSVMEDNGVIVKNIQQKEKISREDQNDHHNPVIPKATHCQGVKRKLLETYSRNATELNNANYFPVAISKHTDFTTSTPLVTNKSEGDGQKDIQMVMENLKALQKLSCSPIKNDNSSSSPVSVIAYNKNFTSSKSTTSGQSHNKNDMSSSGFQDEFQKTFMNSLQQLTANVNSNKSSYNNGS